MKKSKKNVSTEKDFGELFAKGLNRGVLLDDLWRKSIISRALNFAIKAHGNQTRKGDGKPYIVHPIEVAVIVAKVIPNNDYVIASALLHDTVEDTDTTLEDIEKEFGYTVVKIVGDLTEKDKSLPWRKRKMLAIAHIKEMDEWSLIVKTADKLQNLKSLYSAILEKGETVLEKFNAPLKEQLEIDKIIYKELAGNFNKHELWKDNPLLAELKEAIEDVEQSVNRSRLIKR